MGFHKFNTDYASKKEQEFESRNKSIVHDIDKGWNFFFIMPPWNETARIWKEVQQHGMMVCSKYSDEPKDGKLRPNAPCLMCQEVAKRKRSGDKDFLREFGPRPRAFFNAIRKEDIKKKDPDCVKVLSVTPGIFSKIVTEITSESLDISDPKAAWMIGIHKTGKGLSTKYEFNISKKSYNISKLLTSDVQDAFIDLDKFEWAQPASVKDMREALSKYVGSSSDSVLSADADFEDEEYTGDDDEGDTTLLESSKEKEKPKKNKGSEDDDLSLDDMDESLVDDDDDMPF